MEPKAQSDELVMNLVDLALSRPADERQDYLETACGGDADLLEAVRCFVQWEERMQGFLQDPVLPTPSGSPVLQPGRLLDGRFRIIREIGQGAMGIVYESADERLGRRIALKCSKPGHSKRLAPEVRHASEISHPNVCRMFEIHTTAIDGVEVDFITMEYLDGETLSERLRRGPIPEAEARTIARQLAAGLTEAHRNQVIHGDLKSGNVILTRERGGALRAVITDFGLARSPGTSQRTAHSGDRGGTPDYMAPELWKGEKASVASDIYAMGVILYELASGRRAHQRVIDPADSDASTVSASRIAPAWQDRLNRRVGPVHPKWDAVLARCLHPDPKQRFGTAANLVEALAPSHSRRIALGVAAAVVLAAVSGAVTYQRATGPHETVRLAVLPVESANLPSETLSRDLASRLSRIQGSKQTDFAVVPAAQLRGASHILRTQLQKLPETVTLRVTITDQQTGVDTRVWQAEYTPDELKFIPAAVGGIVTWTFDLPVEQPEVNAAAKREYEEGLKHLRRNTTLPRAVESLDRAVASDPDSPLTHAALAEALSLQYVTTREKSWLDRFAHAVRAAEIRNPDLAEVHRIAGWGKRNDGRYPQAVDEYRRAIELDPGNGDAHRRLGQVYELNGQLTEALAAYHRAVEVDPTQFRNYQELASYYFQRADYPEAVRQLRQAINLAPDEPALHLGLGTTYANLGQYIDLEQEVRTVLRLAETAPALHALGLALMYQGRDREAIPYFRQALRLEPGQHLWWMNLAIAFRRTGAKGESEKANARALRIAERSLSADPREADGKVRAQLAYLCARLGNKERAESEIAQALRVSPTNADTRWLAAVTYEALGERERTLDILSSSPPGVLADFSRWPDVSAIRTDSRFRDLLAIRKIQ